MSIASAIREAVLYDSDTLNDDELLNKVCSAFMQKGDWLNSYTHALTFALFVAEALAPAIPRADLQRVARYLMADGGDDAWLQLGEWQRLAAVVQQLAEEA